MWHFSAPLSIIWRTRLTTAWCGPFHFFKLSSGGHPYFFAEHLPTLETTARGSKVRSDKSGKSVISNLTDTKIEHVR